MTSRRKKANRPAAPAPDRAAVADQPEDQPVAEKPARRRGLFDRNGNPLRDARKRFNQS